MSDTRNTGTQVPPSGTGTQIAPGSGTMVPPAAGTGTAVAPGTAVPPTGAATQPRAGGMSMIPEYPEYVMRGIRYMVCPAESSKTLSKKSGEAKIFVVENGGRKFVIKLYIPGHSPNHAILDEVQKAKGGFMISLHDHGKWTDPSHPGLTLDYEIMAYAPYGSLADVKLRGDEKRLREVAWRMTFCIKQCHDLGILHRDIKPENFLFTDAARKQFVITDFGIARSLSGKGPVKVDTAKSSYFVSPEGSMSSKDRTTYVDRATDYYSMGMTLLALWIGLDTFYALFPYDQLEELDRLKLNNKVISEIGDDILGLSAYSRSLLERLLEAGDQNRADFDEIKRWYDGETLKTGSAAEAAMSTSAFSVTFDETKGKVAHSREELASMMMADMEFAKSFIYRGMAKNALQSSFPRLAAEIDDIPQRLYPRPDEQATGVYAACLILDPSLPFTGRKGKPCNTPKEISRELREDQAYYTEELKKKASPLWAFLKVRGGAVKDFPDKYQPMIARSGAHGLFALSRALDPSVPLVDKATHTPIKTAAELSKMLWRSRGTMATELANPDHMVWTWLASLGPNAAQLATTYPAKIKSGGTKELYALCLALDKTTPYYGKKNNPCSTERELGREIWDSLSDYQKELSDPNHLVWQYMRTWNDSWRKIADSYPSLIKAHPNEYTCDLVYRLDPTMYNTLQDGQTKKWVRYDTFDELVAYVRDHEVTPLTLELIARRDFITWLSQRPSDTDRKRAALLDSLVKQAGADAKNQGWYLLYSLVPELGLYLKKGEDHTAQQLGEAVNSEANRGGGLLSDMLLSPSVFRGSRLHQYMRARKMGSYISGIEKIIDVQANISAHKSAPYDVAIARWKVVDYLGARPAFRFHGSKKVATTLDDVKSVSQQERNGRVNDGLAAFLTLFFHERKGGQFSFDQLKAYYDFLATYCPSHSGLQKSASARSRVNDAVDGRDKAWRSLSRTRTWVTWLCMVPMVAIVTWMLITSFTDGQQPLAEAFMGIGGVIAVGLAIICGLYGLAEGGIFGGIIGALLGYWIPYGIFSLLSGLAPYVLAALVIVAAIWCLKKLNSKSKDTLIPDRATYDRYKDQADVYVVCEAFGTTGRTFGATTVDPSSVFDRSRDIALAQRAGVRKGAIGMVILAVVTLAIGISLMKTVDNIESGEYGTVKGIPTQGDMAGHWTGTFHGRDAEIDLQLDYGTLKGEVTINYSKPMTQQVSGAMDGEALILIVGDGSGATYSGTATMTDSDDIIYSGDYTNPRKGTHHTFTFTKPCR